MRRNQLCAAGPLRSTKHRAAGQATRPKGLARQSFAETSAKVRADAHPMMKINDIRPAQLVGEGVYLDTRQADLFRQHDALTFLTAGAVLLCRHQSGGSVT
jgi:hypothetical protein